MKDSEIDNLKDLLQEEKDCSRLDEEMNIELKKSSNFKSLEIRRLENENRKMSDQIKMVESRFAEIVTERNNLMNSNKKVNQTVLIRDEKIKSLEEKLGISESENKKLEEKMEKMINVSNRGKSNKRSSIVESDDCSPASKRARTSSYFKDGNDDYCWICRKYHKYNCRSLVCCDMCPRVFHPTCIPDVKIPNKGEFACPECTKIQKAENLTTKSPSLKNVTNESEYSVILLNLIFYIN